MTDAELAAIDRCALEYSVGATPSETTRLTAEVRRLRKLRDKLEVIMAPDKRGRRRRGALDEAFALVVEAWHA